MYDPYYRLVGRSKKIKELKKSIEKIAGTDMPVLLTGETGVGKEVVARVIHDLSPRATNPYIPLNMAAIPDSMVESQLFGYKKGAFTGALKDYKGSFVEADRGTLFMDEIGEMNLPMQSKLLRVLNDQKVLPLGGGVKDVKQVDVRIISATNRDLQTMVKRGQFREDLYYRLNVLPVHIPPLRERREDVPLLIDHFIREMKHKGHLPFRLTEKALISLQHSPWRGNVRELQQVVQRLTIYYPGQEVRYEDLPLDYRIDRDALEDKTLLLTDDYMPVCLYGDAALAERDDFEPPTASRLVKKKAGPKTADQTVSQRDDDSAKKSDEAAEDGNPLARVDVRNGLDLSAYLKEIEFELIVKALKEARGNNSQAARLLKMNRTTLVEKLKRYGIRSEDFIG